MVDSHYLGYELSLEDSLLDFVDNLIEIRGARTWFSTPRPRAGLGNIVKSW